MLRTRKRNSTGGERAVAVLLDQSWRRRRRRARGESRAASDCVCSACRTPLSYRVEEARAAVKRPERHYFSATRAGTPPRLVRLRPIFATAQVSPFCLTGCGCREHVAGSSGGARRVSEACGCLTRRHPSRLLCRHRRPPPPYVCPFCRPCLRRHGHHLRRHAVRTDPGARHTLAHSQKILMLPPSPPPPPCALPLPLLCLHTA